MILERRSWRRSSEERGNSLLVTRTVAEVWRPVRAAVPDALFGIDVVIAFMRVLIEAHRIEDVELRLGPEYAVVATPLFFQERFRLARDVAGSRE